MNTINFNGNINNTDENEFLPKIYSKANGPI